ncbi:SPOR domain-containing protein [Iodobacter ciconiae]|uniref:SPOR domain-containing protein n=1 Tax=Iodobacter ciconiae TaxID=2496266 RepID=A0A3S8ZRB5_9NEIS|nr:SPOR domain-containing protein [Iodobacter ciconiae]AZN36018.1 hypothetical protein EJO50_05725 [Iodobacter ciconiae]
MNDALDPILQQESQRRLKVQLAWRLGIAAALIMLSLFGIHWLDQQSEQPPVLHTPTPLIAPGNEPAPVLLPLPTSPPAASAAIEASSAINTQPPITSNAASGLIEGAKHRLSPTLAPAPTQTGTPTLKLEPVAEASPAPQKTAQGTLRIAEPSGYRTPASATTSQRSATPYPSSTATTSTPASATASTPPYPAAQHTANGFTVQAGVFLHAPNAGKLLSQLKAAGIPAYAETRIQIGPFKDKASADAAAEKLKRMGIEPIVRGN